LAVDGSVPGKNQEGNQMVIAVTKPRKALFHHFFPASLYGGQTALPALSRIDRELRQCQRAEVAAGILDRAKPDLCALLRFRFPSPLAEALTLKVLNLFLARYHFQARSACLLSRPFGLVVDPSNACQLACPGCVHSVRNEALQLFDWPKATLSEDRFSALLKRYGPYAIEVYFYNYGEPLLNLNTQADPLGEGLSVANGFYDQPFGSPVRRGSIC